MFPFDDVIMVILCVFNISLLALRKICDQSLDNNSWWRHQSKKISASTGHRWISLTKASDVELWCFLWSAPEQTVKQTSETSVIWDDIALIMTALQCWEPKHYDRVVWLKVQYLAILYLIENLLHLYKSCLPNLHDPQRAWPSTLGFINS